MKAAVFKKLRAPLEVETLPDPAPGPGEVVVEVCRCGICGSDLHITEDPIFGVPTGIVLGHEYSGRVAAVGRDVQGVAEGEHVAVFPVHGCGHCATCLAGLPAWCRQMRVDGGGYGQYALAEPHQLVRLPRTLSLQDGALVEPMAVSLHGVTLAESAPGARVLVLGAGPIGLAAAFWARRLGAGRVAVTASSTRRAGLALAMGAHVFIDPADASPTAVEAALGGRRGNVVQLLLDARATRTPGNEARLTEALSRYLGEPVRLQFEVPAEGAPVTPAREMMRQDEQRIAEARAALESDPTIQAFKERMGATIFPESVRPNFTEEN